MLFVPFYLLILLAATSELVISNDHNSVNGKLFDKTAEEAFWFEQFQNVEPERSRDVKLDEFICELSKKQRMLETIFEPKNNYPHSNEPFSMNEYKFLKSRKNSIHHKDPALSQVLDYLFVAQMSAKRTMQSLPDMDDGFLTIKTLRQRVGYALVFLSKRHRIQLDEPREHFVFTKSVQKHFVQELINFLDQAKKCNRRVNKKGQSCANECANENEENYSNKKRQFFQFAVKTIGIDWDGSAFSNRQKKRKPTS